MGKPAAKQGDKITGTCTHTAIPGTPPPPSVVVPGLPFMAAITGGLSSDVRIQGQFAATKDSTGNNVPPHVPPPSSSWKPPGPDNKGTITAGSGTVKINGKQAARAGDQAKICDEIGTPGVIVAVSTVSIGD